MQQTCRCGSQNRQPIFYRLAINPVAATGSFYFWNPVASPYRIFHGFQNRTHIMTLVLHTRIIQSCHVILFSTTGSQYLPDCSPVPLISIMPRHIHASLSNKFNHSETTVKKYLPHCKPITTQLRLQSTRLHQPTTGLQPHFYQIPSTIYWIYPATFQTIQYQITH